MLNLLMFVTFLALARSFPQNRDSEMRIFGNSVNMYYLGSADGKSFFAQPSAMNWTNSKQFCEASAMQLASVTSQLQFSLLTGAYNDPEFKNNHWVDAHDALDLRQFVWNKENATPDASYVTLSRQPVLNTCLAFRSAAANSMFIPIVCSNNQTYLLCEIAHS